MSDVQMAKDMIGEGTKVLTLEEGFTASWIKLCYEDLPGFRELLSQVPAYHNTKLALEGLCDWYE